MATKHGTRRSTGENDLDFVIFHRLFPEHLSGVQPTVSCHFMGWLAWNPPAHGWWCLAWQIGTLTVYLPPIINHEPPRTLNIAHFLQTMDPLKRKLSRSSRPSISFWPLFTRSFLDMFPPTLFSPRCFPDALLWTHPYAWRKLHRALSAWLQSRALRDRSYRRTRIAEFVAMSLMRFHSE